MEYQKDKNVTALGYSYGDADGFKIGIYEETDIGISIRSSGLYKDIKLNGCNIFCLFYDGLISIELKMTLMMDQHSVSNFDMLVELCLAVKLALLMVL